MCKALRLQGWTILYHNVKIWRTQVDIVARMPCGVLTLVEVKSQMPWNPGRQLFRLNNVCTFLAEFEPVELRLAFVQDRRVTLLPV